MLEAIIDGTAFATEDDKKLVEKRFGFGLFALGTGPRRRESQRARTHLFAGECRHDGRGRIVRYDLRATEQNCAAKRAQSFQMEKNSFGCISELPLGFAP